MNIITGKTRTSMATLVLLAAVAGCGSTDDSSDDSPDDFPVNAERRAGPGADPDAEPGAGAPAPIEDEVDEIDVSDEDVFALAMEMTFDDMSAGELSDICEGLDLFGMDMALSFYAEGYGADWKPSYAPLVTSELRERC